jgi:hypothetical protein
MANSNRESATIYQFPPRGRFVADDDECNRAMAVSPRVTRIAIGSGWYHDDAIREAEQARKK